MLAAALLSSAIGCAPPAGTVEYPAAATTQQAVQALDPEGDRRPIAQATVAVMPFDTPVATPARFAGQSFSAADASAPTTGPVIEGGVLGHDPAVAVGERFVIVYGSHRYQVHDKATGAVVADNGEVPPSGDFTKSVFAALWAPRAADGSPNPANINTKLRFAASDPKQCDPESPTKSHACVQEFYDTRILWDEKRKRFWVESAVRNHLWQCAPGARCDGEKQSATQARRYIAIAVSRTEDPRQGFHRYILVDEYSDWPKFAINDHYLLLAHRSSKWLYVYDADKLAAGNPDLGPVLVSKIDVTRVPGVKWVAPATHHGPTDRFTFLLGSNNTNTVSLVALWNPSDTRADRPVLIAGPRISVGERVGTLENNAIYRAGKLYWTWDTWAPGHEKDYRQINVARVPVEAKPSEEMKTSGDPARGFLHAIIGGREPDDAPDDVVDYEKPALDVNAAGDIVVVYSRRGYQTRAELAPEVRYSILYHGETRARAGVLLKRGSWAKVPDINDNGKAGIDLAGAQVDPSDDRSVWVAHAYSDAQAKWYRHIVGVVKP